MKLPGLIFVVALCGGWFLITALWPRMVTNAQITHSAATACAIATDGARAE